MTRVTDDPAVVVERDSPVVAVELGTEEREARRIERYSVPQSHPTAIVENAASSAKVVGAGHEPGHPEPARATLGRRGASAAAPDGTTRTGHAAFRTRACDVPPTTSVRIGP